MATRADVEYQIAGVEQELLDGLARLERADGDDDHAEWYRRAFARDIAALRRELDKPVPDIHELVVRAMQAAWLARIWPVLSAARLKRHSQNLDAVNRDKRLSAAAKRERCIAIARTLRRPTPAAVRDRYVERFAVKPPGLRTISRYLATLAK